MEVIETAFVKTTILRYNIFIMNMYENLIIGSFLTLLGILAVNVLAHMKSKAMLMKQGKRSFTFTAYDRLDKKLNAHLAFVSRILIGDW